MGIHKWLTRLVYFLIASFCATLLFLMGDSFRSGFLCCRHGSFVFDFTIIWAVGSGIFFIPVILFIWVLDKIGTHSPYYYFIFGLAIGPLMMLVVFGNDLLANMTDKAIQTVTMVGICGCISSMIYWALAERKTK